MDLSNQFPQKNISRGSATGGRMTDSSDSVRIAPWKNGKRFAYSITYDEGRVEILGFAWRIHRDYRIPGHVNVFPRMLGKLLGDTSAGFLQSLWNLQKYAEPEHLRFLIGEGWSIGCQFSVNDNQSHTAYSLRRMRLCLAEAISCPVRSLAFGDATSWKTCRNLAQEAGFRWLFTIYDDLNPADEDSGVINRSPLYHRGPKPRRLANDPYRLLALGQDRGGWIVDMVRLVDRYPLDPTRDCTPAELEARFKAVHKIGAGRVWIASPEAVAGYRALRLSTQIQNCVATSQKITYTLALNASDHLPVEGELTFVAHLRSAWESPRAIVGGSIVQLEPGSEPGSWLFTHRVIDGLQVAITDGSRGAA
jgi:hypothetical protein